MLEDIEYPLGNGNFIDFKLLNIQTKEAVYIEVVSIHPNKELPSNYDDMNTFISKRINDKVALKNKEVNNQISFTLTPIIWAPHTDLHKLYLFFKDGNKLDISSSIEPSAYASFYNEETDYLVQKFGRVSTLFTD